MHTLVRPKYFIPVHGEYRMLWQHAELAESMGMDRKNIVLPVAGQVIEMSQDSLTIAGTVPTGEVLWTAWASATWATWCCATASTSPRTA